MPVILFILFVVIPVAEIATFIQVGSVFGLGPTLAGILVTALIGAFLVRQQGFKALNDARANLESNKLPVEQVVHGFFILAAGLLLLTPGFLTDSIGFLFLIPPLRIKLAKVVWQWLKANANISVSQTGFQQRDYQNSYRSDDEKTIDEQAVEINPKAGKPPKISD